MKIRRDFVSNSSSSSFIVINSNSESNETDSIKNKYGSLNKWDYYEFPTSRTKCQFGWEFENTRSFEGKLNFVGLQLLYLLMMKINGTKPYGNNKINPDEDFDKYYLMVQKVCADRFGINVKLDTDPMKVYLYKGKNDKYCTSFDLENNMYIDHRSCATEGRCMEMFESEDKLYDFLSNSNSYVEGGNDNG